MYLYRYLLIFCLLFIETNIIGQTIIFNNGKYGILDNDSKEIAIPSEYDEIIAGSESESFELKNEPHSFILRKDNKYYFALKEWKKTTIWKENAENGRIFPPLEGEDSVKWHLFKEEFDEVYRLDRIVVNKDANVQDYEIYFGDTIFNIHKYIYPIVFRKDGKCSLLTFERTSRTFGNYIVENIRYSKIKYSIDNIQIYPARYDDFFNIDSELIGFVSEKKYGFINLKDGYEIAPEFDNTIVPLKYKRYYYAKKNGLWGVIYINKYSSGYSVSIPFRYAMIDDISRNLQSVNFYNRRIFKTKEGNGVQLQDAYIACLYQSSKDSPLQLEFVIYNGESFTPTVSNVITKNEQLNKEYIPPTEKHITFTPLINNAPVIQQDRFEFICISKSKENVDDTSSWFFILKRERKWHRNDNHYVNEIIEAKAIYSYMYDFTYDRFVPIYNFDEELENINYNVIVKPRDFDCNLILKSTSLENEKFKHEFFTFKGLKVYELISNYPVNYVEYLIEDYRGETYNPDWHVLKFYTEIPRKKKTKKKTVCHYNTKTKRFYK